MAGLALLANCRSTDDRVSPASAVEARSGGDSRVEHDQRSSTRDHTTTVSDRDDETLPVLDGPLTLERARSIALRKNPDIHAAVARIELAAARVQEAGSRFMPTLSVTHNSARTFLTPASRNRLANGVLPSQSIPTELTTASLAITTLLNAIRQPLFGAGLTKGDSSTFSDHSTALTATWSIFDGFVRDAQLASAKHVWDASTHALGDIRRLIASAVDSAYYRIQLADEQVRIAQADQQFSEEQLREVEKLRAAGRASASDVDNFKIRMLSARTDLSAALGSRDVGRVVLAELMGLPGAELPAEWQLTSLSDETVDDLQPPPLDEWSAKSLAVRADIKQLEQLVRSEEANVLVARGLYRPTLAVSGSWGYDHMGSIEYSKDDQSAAVGVELRWDIYTGGARDARLRAAESQRSETAAQLARLRLAVQSDVRSAITRIVDAQQRIVLQRETLATSRESRRIVQAAYLAGKEPLTRLNEAQRDYVAADAGLTLARIRLRQAWSDLYAAAGANGLESSETATPSQGD